MKNFKVYLLSLLIILSIRSHAQIIFHENFEVPDSLISSGIPGWSLYNNAQTSGLFSDSSSAKMGDSSYLSTIPFSTTGAYHVILSFNHIVSSELTQENIEVSNDGGINWTTLTDSEYLQDEDKYPYVFPFNNYSYSNWWPGVPFQGPVTNDKWHKEFFDISTLCANQPDIRIRFKMSRGFPSFVAGGWFIDDVIVEGAPYSTSSTLDCNQNGSATVTPYFGTPPYTYQWSTSPVQTTSTAVGLTKGLYVFTVTDAGSTATYTDSIYVNSSISAYVPYYHPSCGLSNGSIYTSVSGINSPFGYQWSNGANSTFITNIPTGIYTVTITDTAGCIVTKSINLFCYFSSNNVTITTTPSQCDSATGTATAQNITLMVPPFTYEWSTIPVQTTPTATGLSGNGYYSLKIIDANNDSLFTSVHIPYSDTLIASAIYTPTTCSQSNGTASASAIGGTAPYTYQWSTLPTQTTQTVSNLSNASYTLTATDANGCKDDFTFTVPNNSGMTLFVIENAENCYQQDGSANASANGGTPPYQYVWSTNPVQTSPMASGLSWGTYTVTVTDANGCSLSKNIFVNSLSPLNISVSYTSPACTCVQGTASVTGGTPPYSYSWDNQITTITDSCLNIGWHYLFVTDANGCNEAYSFYVNYPANCFLDIRGYVYADTNYNCIYEPAEYGIANVALSLTGSTKSYGTLTDNQGYYSFHVLNDSFQLSQSVPQFWNQICPHNPSSVTINVLGGTIVNQDFADSADSYFNDAVITDCWSSPNVRGFNNDYRIQTKNAGTTQLTGTVKTKLDGLLSYIGSFPSGVFNVSGNSVTWNYTSLNPGATETYVANTYIPPGTPLGTLMLDSVVITPLAGDLHPDNNQCNYAANVVGSYDPNYKHAVPAGDMVKDSLWHLYFIQFQNTGSSPAVRVIVTDTLDPNLDLASITAIEASHSFVVDTTELPIIRFIFDNINLMDSGSYEPYSHGHVSFKIKHFTGLPAGTVISNTANIYFDFNSPVITNTVTNTLVNPTGIPLFSESDLMNIYPNPATEKITVNAILQKKSDLFVSLSDPRGRILMEKNIFNAPKGINKIAFDLKKLNLSKGIYFITMKTGATVSSVKLILL